MLATTIIDPLLSSPTQVQRHDNDMAMTFPSSFQTPQLMDSLTYSASYSSEQNDDDDEAQQQQQQYMASLTYSTSVSSNHSSFEQQEDDDEDETPFEQLMNRGNYLRQLRALALHDEMERRASALLGEEEKNKEDQGDDDDDTIESELCDHIYHLNNEKNTKVLQYNTYLAHQRYYDDLKHVDITYMDYGIIPPHHHTSSTTTTEGGEGGWRRHTNENDGARVVIEQRKRLGKGGLCWDAAFMLGEHVIAHEADWNTVNSSSSGGGGGGGGGDGGATVLELGAGTGLCGIMVGKATKSQVTITDLPELEELMDDNVRRNFGPSVDDDSLLSEEERKLLTYLDSGKAKGTVTSRVLRWGVEEDYFLDNSNRKEQENQQPYDVIIGADIVASLYDPVALAQTIYALCGPTTKIYISSKSRLDRPHETFDVEMARLFEKVEKKVCVCSRLKSPNVFIIQAEGKRDKIEC